MSRKCHFFTCFEKRIQEFVDEVKLCPWLLFVPWCWEWRVWGSVKKFAVEWMDFEKNHIQKDVFGASCYPQKRSYFSFYYVFFVGDTKFSMCFLFFFTQLPILNEVSPCFLSTMQPSQNFRKSFPRSSFAGVFHYGADAKIPCQKRKSWPGGFSPPWQVTNLCLLCPQAWIQWKIGKPPFGKLT